MNQQNETYLIKVNKLPRGEYLERVSPKQREIYQTLVEIAGELGNDTFTITHKDLELAVGARRERLAREAN